MAKTKSNLPTKIKKRNMDKKNTAMADSLTIMVQMDLLFDPKQKVKHNGC